MATCRGNLKITGFGDTDLEDEELITMLTIRDEELVKKIRFFFNKRLNDLNEIGMLKVEILDGELLPINFLAKSKNRNEAQSAIDGIMENVRELHFHVETDRDIDFVKRTIQFLRLTTRLLPIPSGKKETIIRVFGEHEEDIDKFKRTICSHDPIGERPGSITDKKVDVRPRSSHQKQAYRHNSGSFYTKLDITTIEGLNIKVYKEPITRLKVDAIVNAANDTLSNVGGVAFVISKAAGKQLESECKKVLRTFNGKLHDSQNVVTCAGDLPYAGVIHAVGPSWYHYKDKAKCLQVLIDTIVNILITARDSMYSRVAMPPISSGIFGVPKPMCAAMYWNGVHKFCAGEKLGQLKEFHIIDIHDEVLDMVVKWHERSKSNPTCLEVGNVLVKEGYVGNQSMGYKNSNKVTKTDGYDIHNPHSNREQLTPSNLTVLNSLSNTKIKIYTADILGLKNVDAVVVSEDPSFQGEGGLAQTLLKHGGDDYRKKHDKLKRANYKSNYSYGKVLVTPAGKSLPFKRVFHAIINRCPSSVDDYFRERLAFTFSSIMSEVESSEKRQVNEISLAMPMIGTGGLKNRESIYKCCQIVDEAIWSYLTKNRRTKIRQIHLVNGNDEITQILCEIYQRRVQRGPPPSKLYPAPKTSKPLSKDNHTKGLKRIDVWRFDENAVQLVDVSKYINKLGRKEKPMQTGNLNIIGDDDDDETVDDDDCIICMCEKTEPVQFTKCKHSFCLECISDYFAKKPACPMCATIYGKMYGDQPRDGLAEIFLDPSSLPGYEGKETFVIEYEFPDGKQQDFHPDPKKQYEGIIRRGYLPKSEEGRHVLDLFKRAFEQGLTFTIGNSRTSGKEGVITWNDIHHKTSKTGGPQKFGYPDSEYLSRVKEELAAKGIIDD